MRTLSTISTIAALALAAVSLAGCGGDAAGGPPPESRGGTPPPDAVALEQPAEVGGMTWTVLRAERLARIKTAGRTYVPEGVYVVVSLALHNEQATNGRAEGDDVTLAGGDGKTYEVHPRASAGYHSSFGPHTHDPAKFDPTRPDPIYGFTEVPPEVMRAAAAVFEVPEAAAKGAKLQVDDEGETVLFELGL